MVKAGIGLTEWPKHEGLEQYTSISLMKSYIEVLPDGLVQRRVPKDFVLPTKLLSIIDMTQQHVPSTAFSNLVNLSLRSVGLREICSGVRPPRGFLDNLEILNIDSCNRMSCLFPTMLIQRLRKLKKVSVEWCVGLQDVFAVEGLCYTKENPFLLSSLACLELKDLPNMRKIWKGPTQQVSLQSLTFVQVYGCHELRYVFTLTLARSLLQLEVLRVSNCASLEHIVEINAEENVTAGCGNDVVLPKLRIVQLSGLENLINFCSENYCSTWPALQELEIDSTFFAAQLEANVQQLRVLRVERSDQLSTAVVAQLRNGFQNLEELRICYCGGVQVIFQLEGLEQELSLPSLKVLELKYLDELECLWKGPTHLLNLQNLKKLIVTGCNRLRHMFSPTLAGNLLHLEQLIIEYCGELEQIIVGDHTEDHVQLGLFPNLSSIYVRKCDKLKTLFPVSIARSGLQKLTSLEVEETFQLEELFGHEDEADTVELVVTECPKITTKFSVDQNRSVHAEVEAPQTGKEHVDMEESPPDVTREINCWSSKRCCSNGKSIHKLLRNPFPCGPNPQVFHSLINPRTQELYLQRPVLWDGFDFVDFVRGKPSLAFDRMEAARGSNRVVSDGDESEDAYGSDDEVKITDSDLENLLDSDEDSDEEEE
ncbi:hypothetical protein JRO89_XS15G0116100 [Xanthoceras sorbifolium]|uniref:Disease resistance protein At4g27190-like leucine-rich repeats domain-containing protein n=1 Tax=Xanthoceras sorbifolium TaxID=99658 RepID=A0ABQ8H1U3_9ROSI|nr:hypothetical protein JRO89_XS15G0116100 [Xanthoceras sorbifolium]